MGAIQSEVAAKAGHVSPTQSSTPQTEPSGGQV